MMRTLSVLGIHLPRMCAGDVGHRECGFTVGARHARMRPFGTRDGERCAHLVMPTLAHGDTYRKGGEPRRLHAPQGGVVAAMH